MTDLDKAAVRAAALALRAKIPAAEAEAFGARLGRLGPDLARAHEASVVSVFWSFNGEMPTRPLIEALCVAGFTVALPVTGRRGSRLVFRLWTPEIMLVPGCMGLLEPPEAAEIVEPDLLFVPLAAFDRRGHRVGYGAGFYDRTLEDLRSRKRVVAIGLAYAAQEILFIPSEDHDQPLDAVVTETDTILCADAD